MTIESTLERIASALETIAKNGGVVMSTVSNAPLADAPKRGPGRPPKAAPAAPPDYVAPDDDAPVDADGDPVDAEGNPIDGDAPADETPADEPEPPKAKPKAAAPAAAAAKPTAKGAAQAIVEKRVVVKMRFKDLLGAPGGRPKALKVLKGLGVEVISAVPDDKLDKAIAELKRAAAAA